MFKHRQFARLLLLGLWVSSQALGQSDDTSVERDKPQQNPPATESWLDNWHSNFSESMDYTAQRLDEFFALADSDEHENARAEGRVRFGWEPRTRDLAAQDFRFRVRVKLPALKDRVDLMLSDDESYDRQDSIRAARDAVNEITHKNLLLTSMTTVCHRLSIQTALLSINRDILPTYL